MKVFLIVNEIDSYAIVPDDSVENIELSEAYDNYGQKWGEEYDDMYADAITYHDGQKWKTKLVGDNSWVDPDLEYIDKEKEQEIISAYNELSSGDWETNNGVKIAYNGKYKFYYSLWSDDNWNIAIVEEY